MIGQRPCPGGPCGEQGWALHGDTEQWTLCGWAAPTAPPTQPGTGQQLVAGLDERENGGVHTGEDIWHDQQGKIIKPEGTGHSTQRGGQGQEQASVRGWRGKQERGHTAALGLRIPHPYLPLVLPFVEVLGREPRAWSPTLFICSPRLGLNLPSSRHLPECGD